MEINRLTQEAAQYNVSAEFSGLLQSIGGESVNAGTSYDYTVYYNSFPPNEIHKWLELFSERLINPVFRSFQPELETVYEEYNRGQDQSARVQSEFIMSNLFAGHPYSRSVIGLPEHLKNPQLSQLTKFYNTWYVPNNMALIIAGNVKVREIVSTIRTKFGRLEKRELPTRRQYPETPLKGRKEISSKLSRYPQVLLAYPGIAAASEDDIALDVCASILSNSSRTGLLDKLVIDGDLQAAAAQPLSLKDRGYVEVIGVPNYDSGQRRFESLGSVEKMLLAELKKLKEGKFEDWLVQSIKNRMIREHDLEMESNEAKCYAIADVFLTEKDMSRLMNYNELVASLTTEQIKETAKKYFGDDYFAFRLNEGKPPKGKELEKPKYKPITPVRGQESAYATAFKNKPVKYDSLTFANMDEVQVRSINDRSKLYYTKNPENEVFTLTLKFGVGTTKMPLLDMSVSLMSNAGIMGQMDAQEVQQEFSNLGASCRYRVDGNYLYVTMNGYETNLAASCQLLTRQILFPKLDEKQMNSLQGGEIYGRIMEQKTTEYLNEAMREYLLYGEKSHYIDRPTESDIIELTISKLTGEFQRATDYEAEIHYVGTLSLDEAYEILSKNLPLKQNEKASTSPELRERVKYTENTIYFLPNRDAKQSSIYIYIDGDVYKKEIDPYVDAFNQYFGGGSFNSLVMQEIREYRSMAYSSYGVYVTPPLEGRNAYFFGNMGTQADKTQDAITVYMDLLTGMPAYPDRLANLKNFLKETALVDKPDFRDASQVYQSWRLAGYTQSPAEVNFPTYENLVFDDIVKFYDEKIKGRPIAIGIVGNPKMIDEDALKKYGKVIKLSTSKVFSK
jgi:predicted Zn-dependent peptidase